METVALAIDAPDGSLTNPERVAPATCASDGSDQNRLNRIVSTNPISRVTAALNLFWIVIVSSLRG
jgi:hypothetical protein